jgi:exopolysaccharide biosynthesis polyprenyl glycosylphosphotransferase
VPRRTRSYQAILLFLLLADLLCVVGAYAAAFALRFVLPLPLTTDVIPLSRLQEVNHPLGFLLVTQVALLYFFGFYDFQHPQSRDRLVSRVVAAFSVQLLATTALFFFRGDLLFPRSVLVLVWVFNSIAVVAVRLWVSYRLGQMRPLTILLVGEEGDVQTFLATLSTLRPFPELHVVGLVSLNGSGPFRAELGAPWLGSSEQLNRILRQVSVDDVILLSPTTWKDSLVDRLLRGSAGEANFRRPRVLVVPSVYDILVGRIASLRLHDMPLVEVVKNPQDDIAFILKGSIDRIVAGVLLVLSLPLLGIAALLIKGTSLGPVFFRQQRVGRGGKLFTVYKLRTMKQDAEALTGAVLAQESDPRVTPVGRFLRESRIDEIPQLFNVLNGSMSLVGPRPERPEFVEEFSRTIPGYTERHQVKPGLTGLAQVNGEYHTTPEYKLKYDLAYIYNYSFWLDIRIMVESVKVMLTRRGV